MSAPESPTKIAPAQESPGLESSGLEPASLAQAGGAQVRSFPPTDGRPTAHSLSSKSTPDSPGKPIHQALQAAYDPDSATALIDLVESRWQEVEADNAALDYLLGLVANGYVIPADFSVEVGDAIHAHACTERSRSEPPLLQMAGQPRDETDTVRPVRHEQRPIDPAAHRPPPPAKLDFSARQDATAVERRGMTELGPQNEIEGVTIEAKDETPWDRSKWKATGIEGMIQKYESKQHGRDFHILEVGNPSGGNDYFYYEPGLGYRWIPFNPPAPRDFNADLQAEIARQQPILDASHYTGMMIYMFATTEVGGMFTSAGGAAGRGVVRAGASEGADASAGRMGADAAKSTTDDWASAGRQRYMGMAEESVEEAAQRIARLNVTAQATGQNHHILSNKIMRALDDHETLAGVFKRDDRRFQYVAKDSEAHKGYCDWHRELDKQVIGWINLDANKEATPKEFIHYLHNLYQQPLHRSRIPNVNLTNIEP